ncbi:hypothetical protein G7Y89_g7187 [Cudoniella acicularis]|uniref:Uncharacterized protein n=1 Tax=Cudoniella acicularis TaxID=354080 RepID=A0A8H4RJ11_9HELO|nr:hypothetical protein G7Y89_g7187 [Cudoniella acicularis]
MERITKVFFDPLATTKAQIQAILEDLPIGSAHPFSPDRILLCRTADGIDEIDISSYPEDFFFNAVDLGELGETLLRRMAGFPTHLSVFNDYNIQQAPASTFKVPIVSDQIAVLAVSERTPTYYDFCVADAACNTCCWLARETFPGVTHSGDILHEKDLLDYFRIKEESFTEKELGVFISGYQYTQITRFLGTNPALLVANHAEKVLYVIPVPLDAATIGDATICCPLVIKRDGNSLLCSILPTATTDREKMCCGKTLPSPCFEEAIRRADFTIPTHTNILREALPNNDTVMEDVSLSPGNTSMLLTRPNAVLGTKAVIFPSVIDQDTTQIITFGTGLEFKFPDQKMDMESDSGTIVLPCIFGSQLNGPVLLATGVVPSNVPFSNEYALRTYYAQLKSVVVVVDDRMTDNARNLASPCRVNALFIVQVTPEKTPKNSDDVLSLLDSVNINAVTALAGPQSLVLVQILRKYYFYRGLANRAFLNTSNLVFGSDVTSILESAGVESILDPRVKRLINLEEANTIILPTSGRVVQPQDLKKLFEQLPVDQIQNMEEDISAAIPQLQSLLNQTDLQELAKTLVATLSTKVSNATNPMRTTYINFLTQGYRMEDPDLVKKKNAMLGELRNYTKKLQKNLESAISSLANMISSQTTSKRTHDLQRLVRQTKIQSNVDAVKSMTFDTLAGFLEAYAGDMGVMLLNIETGPYQQLLGNLKTISVDASNSCCDLDSRVLHLEGFDAGIIIEQSQGNHYGPLQNQLGPAHPILALPYLSQGRGTGSMLAWVCWDEFVNLESPFTVRWMEKCNDAHIAALRIIMRSTLSQAVASREHNIQPGSPETGHLMSSLLMAAMSKLAAMRTTAPTVTSKAEDTVTRLMRGLFGNLLTTAGSGVRPLSMVWQLFGTYPQFDLPSTDMDWVWYETVVALYPYTGWPLQQFHENLEKFLDKVVIRVVTKNEKVDEIKAGRVEEMVKYCKLRNIQLEHSRTILTIFMRILTEDTDYETVARRLLKHLPQKLQKQSRSYTKMIQYLKHLATGGQRRVDDDLVTASVYTKRSAAFGELKKAVSAACKENSEVKIKESCQKILDKHTGIATLWNLDPTLLKSQNIGAYKDLLEAKFGEDIDEETKAKNEKLFKQVIGDAEQNRVPWQVGKEGQLGDNIEPFDEAFAHEIITGDTSVAIATPSDPTPAAGVVVAKKEPEGFAQFASTVRSDFISKMEKTLSGEDVCKIIGVPASAMRVFVKALNPDFGWEDLGEKFKAVILSLLEERSGRDGSRPVKRLLDIHNKTSGTLESGDQLQIEG